MPFKLNISEKGKAWKLEAEANALNGKKTPLPLIGHLAEKFKF